MVKARSITNDSPPFRNGNDEQGIQPVARRRGFSQIDRNLARRNE